MPAWWPAGKPGGGLGALTLQAGLGRFLETGRGRYATRTRHTDELARAAGVLERDWRELAGPGAPDSDRDPRPRYTAGEMARLLAALDGADPRLRLALALGLELRLGQVVRHGRRSGLDLSPTGAWGLGRVKIVGAGRKRGTSSGTASCGSSKRSTSSAGPGTIHCFRAGRSVTAAPGRPAAAHLPPP